MSIYEPSPFSPKWFSYKNKGPGVRYEVGVAIESGDIVWAHGPFPCGAWPDLKIFREGMKKTLAPGEMVIADGTYKDDRFHTPPFLDESCREFYATVRAHHETANKRLKQFNILSSRFRHHRSLHSFCFHSVANITKINLSTEPLFYVDM